MMGKKREEVAQEAMPRTGGGGSGGGEDKDHGARIPVRIGLDLLVLRHGRCPGGSWRSYPRAPRPHPAFPNKWRVDGRILAAKIGREQTASAAAGRFRPVWTLPKKLVSP
jgi:hypothetical protein